MKIMKLLLNKNLQRITSGYITFTCIHDKCDSWLIFFSHTKCTTFPPNCKKDHQTVKKKTSTKTKDLCIQSKICPHDRTYIRYDIFVQWQILSNAKAMKLGNLEIPKPIY